MKVFAFALLAFAAVNAEKRRTLIFVEKDTVYGEDLFIIGNNAANKGEVSFDLVSQKDSYLKYAAWSEGVNTLAYSGYNAVFTNEGGQEFQAYGVPAIYTTNDESSEQYHPANTFGEAYWLVEADVECDDTNNGWFRFTTFTSFDNDRTYEKSLNPAQEVVPEEADAPVHYGRCGYVNVYKFNSNRYETAFVEGETYRTDIFIKAPTVVGEDVFILGGQAGCSYNGNCDIPVTVNTEDLDEVIYPAFFTWVSEVENLSFRNVFNGPNPKYQGERALGLPLAYTTNDDRSLAYNALNEFGQSYWFVSLNIECSAYPEFGFTTLIGTRDDLKDYATSNESAINQGAGYDNPIHYAACGDTNVYGFNADAYGSASEGTIADAVEVLEAPLVAGR